MSAPLLLVVGLAGLVGSVVVLVLSLVGGTGERADIARALRGIGRSAAGNGYTSPRDRPLRERVGAPLAAQLGRVGRALTPSGAVGRLQKHLDYAGNPPAWPVTRVVPVKGVALAVGAAVGGGFGLVLGGVLVAVLGGVAGALAGFFIPDLMVYNAGVRRQQELVLSLPDVLDTLVISVEAGLGFDAALAQVGHHGKGPLAREMVRALQEMQIGKSRTQALRSLAARTTVPELRTFVTAVVQAGELGVPIAGVLRENAGEIRIRRRQRAEEVAQKVPIKILFPVLFCIFPALFVVLLGPGALQIVKAFSN
ncbi:MAG TPA: type II secretion system F family protein [Catenuloplanes sp.]|jgi:tight adherence protein C